MPTTEELDPLGQVFEGHFKHAWALFRDDKLEEALQLSAHMLLEPRLSNLHRAGFHLIMAFSENSFLEHAERAVELYRQLPEGPVVNRLRQQAEIILDQANQDAAAMRASRAEAAKADVGAEVNNEPQAQVTEIEVDMAAYIREAEEEFDPALHEAEGSLQETGDLSEDDSGPEEEENRIPSGGVDLGGDVVDDDTDYPSDLEDHISKDNDTEAEESEAG